MIYTFSATSHLQIPPKLTEEPTISGNQSVFKYRTRKFLDDALWIVEMFVGYVKFPSIRISTLVKTGNLIGVKILYVIPFWNRIVEFELKLANTAVKAGVSSCPGACGTMKVDHDLAGKA